MPERPTTQEGRELLSTLDKVRADSALLLPEQELQAFQLAWVSLRALVEQGLDSRDKIADHQRLFDLVRHQRHALLETDLITREEFAEILSGGGRPPNGSVARLESYDEMRQIIATLEATNAALVARVAELLGACATIATAGVYDEGPFTQQVGPLREVAHAAIRADKIAAAAMQDGETKP